MAWGDTDTKCENCGNIIKKSRGITKQNIKRLFTIKFTADELLITFIIIMVIVLALLYKSETQQARDFIKAMKDPIQCQRQCEAIQTNINFNDSLLNISIQKVGG